MKKYRVGFIGLGKMGQGHYKAAIENPRWEIVWACDLSEENLRKSKALSPLVKITRNAEDLFNDKSLDAVSICTLADVRPGLIRKALKAKLHVIAEKPLGASVAEEEALLKDIEASGLIVAVNLFNRNAWYHREALDYIAAGEIGDLSVVRICHMTQMVFPPDFHSPEGAVFHDCGMHYVDVARWYAGSEYAGWHAIAQKMFEEPLPLWVSAHGHFQNGVAFEITNGFIYGLHAKDLGNNSYFDIIGTHGAINISHDFTNVSFLLRGINQTIDKTSPYGGKKLDVMFEKLAGAIDTGDASNLPQASDSVIASQVSQAMVDAAMSANPPNIGTPGQLAEIRKFRKIN